MPTALKLGGRSVENFFSVYGLSRDNGGKINYWSIIAWTNGLEPMAMVLLNADAIKLSRDYAHHHRPVPVALALAWARDPNFRVTRTAKEGYTKE